jgi:hypothetical protein
LLELLLFVRLIYNYMLLFDLEVKSSYYRCLYRERLGQILVHVIVSLSFSDKNTTMVF